MTKRGMPLTFKTWIIFISMTLLLLALLWTFQIVIFNVYFRGSQQERIDSACSAALSDFTDTPVSWQKFVELAKEENNEVYIFYVKRLNIVQNDGVLSFRDDTSLNYYTAAQTQILSTVGDSCQWSQERMDTVCRFLQRSDQKMTAYYEEGVTPNLDYYIYIDKFYAKDDVSYAFVSINRITGIDSAINMLFQQMQWVTAGCFLLSILLAFLLSRIIAKPINKLAKTAEKLGGGDFEVQFDGKGYAEAQKLADTLNFATQEMKNTESMRREFIANVSHDLRTPLTMIKAYAEMIRDISGKNEEKRTKHCEIIVEETDRLALLVADIQSLSKLQSGTAGFDPAILDMSGLITAVLTRFSIMSERSGYVFENNSSEGLTAFADSNKIEQVLYNLIGNAVNYAGADKKIIVNCYNQGDKLRVEICDHGTGIAPEDLAHVWDRYYRTNQKKRAIVGSGLGLNIVKAILETHNATYGVNSVVGEGTCFWFLLNKNPPPEEKQ